MLLVSPPIFSSIATGIVLTVPVSVPPAMSCMLPLRGATSVAWTLRDVSLFNVVLRKVNGCVLCKVANAFRHDDSSGADSKREGGNRRAGLSTTGGTVRVLRVCVGTDTSSEIGGSVLDSSRHSLSWACILVDQRSNPSSIVQPRGKKMPKRAENSRKTCHRNWERPIGS